MKLFIQAFLIVLIATFVPSHDLNAQKTGKVSYPTLGISFTLPDGWVGQETDEGMLVGHQTIAGLILLSTHEYTTLDELRNEATTGLQDGSGTSLNLAGPSRTLNDRTIEAHYTGTLQWQPAKAMALAVLNRQGSGVLMIAIATQQVYGDPLEKALRQIHTSLQFTKPDVGSLIAQWQNTLRGTRLTYMDSYTSGSSYDGGIGGGYSSEARIDLCPQGYFQYSSNSTVGVGGSGVSGYAGGRDQGAGTWEIQVRQGTPTLILQFYNQEEYSYALAYDGDKLLLNGKRYFITSSGEYAPYCP